MSKPDVVVWAHNVHNGNGRAHEVARELLAQMDDLGAHVAAVFEAKALVGPLRDLADDRRVIAETPLPRRAGQPIDERGDTVLVVDRDRLRRSWFAVHDHRWIVRAYQRWHLARRDPVAMRRGRVRGVYAAHLPPGGPDERLNGRAWRDQADHALRWAARGGCRVVVADWNCSRDRLTKYLLRHPSRRIREAKLVGHGVDMILVVRGTVAGVTLGRQGSDHPALCYAITADATGVRALRKWIKKRLRRSRR